MLNLGPLGLSSRDYSKIQRRSERTAAGLCNHFGFRLSLAYRNLEVIFFQTGDPRNWTSLSR